MRINNKLGKLIGRVSGHNSFHQQRWCVTRGGFYTGLLLLVLVLCVCGSPRVAWADDPAQEPPVASEEIESKRPDIAAVVYAAALQMRGSSVDTSPVSFSAAAQQALREESHIYGGFGRPLYSVLRFVQSGGQENVYDLGVAMFFVDAGLRRSAVYGEFTYVLGETQIVVQSARLSPIVPDRPQTVLSIVPADRVPNDLLQTYRTHAELLPWVVVNALSAGEQATVPSGKQPYYIFAASLDRLAEGATLEIRISDDANGLVGEAGDCMDMDYEGWHVAVLPGQFAFSTTPEFFIKMIYTPGTDVKPGKREPRLLGVYSSYLKAVQSGEEPPRGTVLTAESRTVAPGGAVQVPIMLDNAQNVGSLGFQLSYDPAVVQVVNVPKGALLAPASFTSNTQQPGLIIFGFATTQAVSGDGSAAIVEFKAVGAQGSSSALTLSQVEATDASGASVSVEMFGGQVTIAQLSQGDINGDNKVSALDALRALRMYVQLEAENLILDMNGNGRVTPEDARIILEMAKPK